MFWTEGKSYLGKWKKETPRKLPSKGRNTFDYIKAKAKGSVISKNELPDDAKKQKKRKRAAKKMQENKTKIPSQYTLNKVASPRPWLEGGWV